MEELKVRIKGRERRNMKSGRKTERKRKRKGGIIRNCTCSSLSRLNA
jgi:hypothetical protein